ncbi:PAS domain S-box protein [Roseospirillum parvum]|uniref:histidine kinase n=1 Tax=Roseospirillum parvum TaxID=83401 RepID=A0A1G8E8E9_9PROT|nr:PAS domain S-box protein [Roseospirillum parvum]SDH66202.1 PAS domain S-box-containing protein [Roseospirillum parvum]
MTGRAADETAGRGSPSAGDPRDALAAALRRSGDLFRDLALAHADWLFELNADLDFMWIAVGNGGSASLDRLIGRHWFDAVAEAEEDGLASHRAQLANRQGFRNHRLWLEVPGQGRRLVRVSARPVRDAAGVFAGYRGVGVDISDQAEAERRAEDAERRLVRALNSAAGAVAIWSPEDRLVMCNEGFVQLLIPGTRRAELTGRTFAEVACLSPLFQQQDRHEADAWLRMRRDSHAQADGEPVELTLPDGRHFLVRESRTEDGQTIGIYADITNRRLTEAALAESEERYRTLIEMIPDGIIVLGGGRIRFANAAAARLLGFVTPGEMTGWPIWDLVPPRSRAELEDMVSRTEGLGLSGTTFEARLRHQGGRLVVAEISTAPIHFAGHPSTLAVLHDISRQQETQRQLIQAAKLATLGEMAAGLAHELSQPLNIMRMSADAALLKMERGRADPAYLRETFQVLSEQAGRMGEIVQHMRVFSRPDIGPATLFDPRVTIRQSSAMVRKQFALQGIAVDLRMPLDGEIQVLGRPIQLEQVILNMLTNARDALQEKGAAEPAGSAFEPAITLHLAEVGQQVRIRIEDNGPGIPEYAMDRLFDPFFTTKQEGKGTGLGLSISYSVIAGMGGSLNARNLKQGAEFTILLPLARAAQGEPPPGAGALAAPRRQRTTRRPPRVLVVDDEPAAADRVAEFLTERGIMVSRAADGASALALAEENDPDLVLTDLRMPGLHGSHLIAELAERAPDLPVVILTGHLEDSDGVAAAGPTVRHVLFKPLSLSRLAEVVDEVLGPTREGGDGGGQGNG